MKPKFRKNNPLENMMLDVILEGQKEVWKEIEKEKNAWKRIEKRKLFTEALNDLGKKRI